MKMNAKLQTSLSKDVCEEEELLNPFVHHLELETTYDKIKIGLLTVLLLPLRVMVICVLVIAGWLLACVGLWGLTEEELRQKPLDGWRRLLIPLICLLGKSTYMVGGMRLVIKGRQASREEAPILVMAPHSSFLDGGIVYATGFPTIIVRRESGTNPYIGKLINFTQPVYVWRDDPESRQRTIREIVMRATSPEPWPQVLIFPEGTCTNRSCLITFKPGAFYPGVPVQPVCIRYPNKLDTVTWTWEGPSALKLLWYTLTQPYSYCEIEFLPVYTPNEEEKKDPKLFANNVRAVMAKALGVPVVDYTYDDCKLMTKAKEMHLPNASSLFEVQKLRHKLGLQNASAEESLINSNLLCKDCNQITYTEFVNLLHLPLNEPSTHQLFRLYDKNNTGMIDFREYLLGVLAVSGNKTNLEIVKLAFKIYDSSGCGKLTVEDFISALTQTLAITREYALILFNQLDTSHLDYVTLDGFLMFAEKKAEFSSLFELKEKKSSSDSYENCPANLTKKID